MIKVRRCGPLVDTRRLPSGTGEEWELHLSGKAEDAAKQALREVAALLAVVATLQARMDWLERDLARHLDTGERP